MDEDRTDEVRPRAAGRVQEDPVIADRAVHVGELPVLALVKAHDVEGHPEGIRIDNNADHAKADSEAPR